MQDLLGPELRVIITGTIAQWHRDEQPHYYAGAGNKFWMLLHKSGLVPVELTPEDDDEVLRYGVGLTDLVRTEHRVPGEPPVWDLDGFLRGVETSTPQVLAFVSKTAASSYARAVGQRQPRDYGALSWMVGGAPAFVLPGPSGANNGMPLPLRIALWRDLADFVQLQPRR